MTVAETQLTDPKTLASRQWQRNRSALGRTQPALLALAGEATHRFVYGRDGALTALDDAGHWYDGCSLPRRAAQGMLRKLATKSQMACFVGPTHARQIEYVLGTFEPTQAVIAAVPDEQVFRLMLHCCDFSSAIESHRLWFVAGDDWVTQLETLLTDRPGLCMPTSFIRVPAIDDAEFERLNTPARQVFTQVGDRRAGFLEQLRVQRRDPRSAERVACVVALSRFRLWDDIGHQLTQALAGRQGVWTFAHYDPDDPASASAQGLAQAIAKADAVIAVNRTRSDLPAIAPLHVPWLTLMVHPPIGKPVPGALHDQLLLAYPGLVPAVRSAGWNRYQVVRLPINPVTRPADRLTFIGDTEVCAVPPSLFELSSHQVLWEMIHADLSKQPTRLGTDAASYLRKQVDRLKIEPESIDVPLFINRLIVPAYQQALIGQLVEAGVPIDLHGRGWDAIERLRAHWRGPVSGRDQLQSVIDQAGVLLNAWPMSSFHPVQLAHGRLLHAGTKSAKVLAAEFRRIGQVLPHDAIGAGALLCPSNLISWLADSAIPKRGA